MPRAKKQFSPAKTGLQYTQSPANPESVNFQVSPKVSLSMAILCSLASLLMLTIPIFPLFTLDLAAAALNLAIWQTTRRTQ